jgi:hypothetical protein
MGTNLKAYPYPLQADLSWKSLQTEGSVRIANMMGDKRESLELLANHIRRSYCAQRLRELYKRSNRNPGFNIYPSERDG